jgi:cobalamin biosynthesis protein CobW
MATKIPATVITGFLGAGKTSLLRHIIAHADRRLAIVINEFGDLGIDKGIVEGCTDTACEIRELANGCICCTVADDFLPTLETLLALPNPPEHILIETSGLALPKPLVQAFQWPDVAARVTVDGVIAVVDAPAFLTGRFVDDPEALAAQAAADPSLDHDNPLAEVFGDQLACADLVVVNKRDLVGDDAWAQALRGIEAGLRPGVRAVGSSHGMLPLDVLIGLGAAAESDLASRPSHHDGEDGHDHEDFDAFTLTCGPVTDPAAFSERLAGIARDHDVLRLKGFVPVVGANRRCVIQGVGARIDRYFDRPWAHGEGAFGQLVVIGLKGMDRAAIAARLAG